VPKSSMAILDAEHLQAAQHGERSREIADESALGDLEREAARLQPGLEQHAVHETRQVAMAELHRRQVQRDLQRRRPGGGLAARFSQGPFSDRHNQPVLLGGRDEAAGRDQAAVRVHPADQRLEADDLALHARLRLVVQQELAAADAEPQVVLERVVFASAPIHLDIVEAHDAPPLALRPIERGIGVAESPT